MITQKGALKTALTASALFAGGEMLALANPEEVDLLITRAVLDITTPATGAANADVGVAADATTSADTLIDGADVGTAAAIFDNIDDQGVNGEATLLWPADGFVTVTGSASTAGLEGDLFLQYIRRN